MEKYKTYDYNKIAEYATQHGYVITEEGPEVIGENFLVLKHEEEDITISFVLTGSSCKSYFYTCIYTDLKLEGPDGTS